MTASSHLVCFLLLDPTYSHLSVLISIPRFLTFLVAHGGLLPFLPGFVKHLSSVISFRTQVCPARKKFLHGYYCVVSFSHVLPVSCWRRLLLLRIVPRQISLSWRWLHRGCWCCGDGFQFTMVGSLQGLGQIQPLQRKLLQKHLVYLPPWGGEIL